MQVDIRLLNRVPSLNLKPEIDYRMYGRHLENRYDVITVPPIVGIATKNDMSMTTGQN